MKVGDRIGHLVLVREAPRSSWGARQFECQCDCGNVCVKPQSNLYRVTTCGCGCPIRRKKQTTHGKTHHPLYLVWSSMLQRCNNPNDPAWPNYGGRGIAVCGDWRSFENFYRDVSPGYSPGLQLDRTDNNGGYCNENVRWVTQRENLHNRRNSVCPAWALDVAKELGVPRGIVLRRIKSGWDPRKACTTPAAVRRSLPRWMVEEAAKHGITREALRSRVVRGWPIPDAYTKPTHPRSTHDV